MLAFLCSLSLSLSVLAYCFSLEMYLGTLRLGVWCMMSQPSSRKRVEVEGIHRNVGT